MSTDLNLSKKQVVLLKSGARAAQSGGLEKYARRLAQAFLEKGCKVTLLTSGASGGMPEKLETLSLSSTSKLSFRKLGQFDKFCTEQLKQMDASIVFGMDRNRFQTHLRAGNGVHAAYLELRGQTDGPLKKLSFMMNPLHRILLKLEKEAFEHPELQRLFTNSHMVKEEILRHYHTDPKKISVVHNGVEWQEMQTSFDCWHEEKEPFAQALGLDPHTFHFLFVGHNFRRKGLRELLEGAAFLAHEKFHISIVGHDKNLHEYEALAQRLNLTGKVRFFGNTNETMRFYQLADALIIPSLYDPFANVTLEALAMGLYVVSSKTNGGCEVLTKKSGTTIDNLGSPDSMAEALRRALRHPKTRGQADEIRLSVKHLDFSNQLTQITQQCL